MTDITNLSMWDNTRLSSFKTCPRKFFYEHIKSWRPDSKKTALIFGSAWHSALDKIWEGHKNPKAAIPAAYAAFIAEWQANGLPHPDNLSPDDLADFSPRTPQIALEMLHGYVEARAHIFSDPTFELIEVEKPFAVPLDPNDPTIWYIGRLDKVFKYRGSFYIGEHKTSTSYKKGGPFRADFIDSFSPNSQIDGYLFALRMFYGDKATAVWVDAALVHKTEHDGFSIIPVERQHQMIDSWLWEVRYWIDQIEGNKLALDEREADDAAYMAAFPKNTSSCSNFGGCPFLDLCKTLANPAKEKQPPLGYKLEKWDPLDKIDLSKIGFSAGKEPITP